MDTKQRKEPGAIGATFKGQTVTDERCACGHSIREHDPLADLPPELVQGKGPCSKCACTRFTWAEFVFAECTKKTS